MDRYFEEDINFLIKNCLCLKELENKTILVTGATGLVGSTLIKQYWNMLHLHIVILRLLHLEETKKK